MHNTLTPAGAVRLRAKLQSLKANEHANAQAELVRSREEGKLEENEAYLHAQEQCRMIERRIGEISSVLETYAVLETSPPTDRIGFGSSALIEDVDTEKRRNVTLVGEPEADISLGCISITSPLGEVLLDARVGDTVDLVMPRGTTHYEIIEIY